MRKHLRLVALLIPMVLVASNSYAAVKAGSACSKLGSKSVSGGKSYTCIKSGKKLVWDKGVLILKPTAAKPSETPLSKEPESTTNSTKTSASETKFTIPAEPTNFKSLESNLEGIQYWSWQRTRSELEKGSSSLGTVKILIGPNTSPTQPDPEYWFRQTSKIFDKYGQAKQIYVVEFEFQDISWAQQQYQLLQDQTWRSNYLTKASEQCPDSRCRNASAELNSKGEAIILVGEIPLLRQSTDKTENPGRYNGTQQSHEYLHTIQMSNSPEFSYSMLPSWLLEGQAMGTAQAISANTYSEYKELRKIDYPELISMSPIYSSEWIAKFLNTEPVFVKNGDNWAYWRQFPNYRIYDIGALTYEILSALKGPTSVMNLYVAVGKGETFTNAFKSEYGLPWSEAVPYIAKTIAAELKQLSEN